MTKSLSLVMLLFVVFGCATLSEQPETPAAADPENQISSAGTKNVPSNSGVKRNNAGDSDRKQPSSVTLDAEEIRKVQTLLKTVGFDPGPVNGAFGPKTKIALSRLRSSCAGLISTGLIPRSLLRLAGRFLLIPRCLRRGSSFEKYSDSANSASLR